MGIIQIAKDKCKKDGLCVAECPSVIINLNSKEGFPEIPDRLEDMCLACGHCVAVCPHGALTHRMIPVGKCPDIQKELIINEEQAIQFLRSRRSIRFFKNMPVEKDKIQKLIEVARYAPTASNRQQLEWTVFTDKTAIHNFARLTIDWMKNIKNDTPGQNALLPYIPVVIAAWNAGFDAVLRKAPALVIASAPEDAIDGMVDLSLSLSYLELFAGRMGLGTCWAGFLQGGLRAWEPLKKAIGLPENHVHHYPIMLGYPKARYFRLPERRKPKITWK
jgi:nitroreductase/NAD-dependent dihydropyrimidine dehydrogenase PreA subunit